MKAILGPAFAVLGRLGVGATMALISALYLAAPVILLYAPGVAGALVAAACAIAALYLSAANAAWTRIGMARLARAAERIASGDLSVRMTRVAGEGDGT